MKTNPLFNETLFDLEGCQHPQLISPGKYCWEGLNLLGEYLQDYPFETLFSSLFPENVPLARTLVLHNGDILDGENFTINYGNTCAGELKVFRGDDQLHGASVLMAGSCFSGNRIEIGKGVLVECGAMVKSPTIIGDCNEVRQGSYLRGNIITGKSCVLGHTTEIKNAIFLDDAKAGHFNYIGDSILGNKTNLGAGTKFANLRFFGGNLFIEHEKEMIDTGRRKFGAILGDNTQTGCNSVTNPGTILGKNSFVMPNATVPSGYHRSASTIR